MNELSELPDDNIDFSPPDEVLSVDEDLMQAFPDGKIEMLALKGTCLNMTCYRGFAPAKVLSAISQADQFSQESNPEGTQRDLNIQHARDIWRYMDIDGADPETDVRLFAEVLLNIREPDVVEIENAGHPDLYKLTFVVDRFSDDIEKPDISRVEGNHRLTYARGTSDLPPIDAPISFCMTLGVDKLLEAKLFRDINANQRPMNTSHLSNVLLRLSRRDGTQEKPPEALLIADRLATDEHSPFFKDVDRGGVRDKNRRYLVTLKTLESVIRLILVRSDELQRLKPKSSESHYSLDEKYALICAFWQGVKDLFPVEWADGKTFVLRRSAGMLAMSMAAAHTIDTLSKQKGALGKMRHFLEPLVAEVDWTSKTGPLTGLNGVGGANRIFKEYVRPYLQTETVDDVERKEEIAKLLS